MGKFPSVNPNASSNSRKAVVQTWSVGLVRLAMNILGLRTAVAYSKGGARSHVSHKLLFFGIFWNFLEFFGMSFELVLAGKS